MNKADIDKARQTLQEISDRLVDDPARLEILMDRLAGALLPLTHAARRGTNMDDVLQSLASQRAAKFKLQDIYQELQGCIEKKAYGDEDDHDNENELFGCLLEDFRSTLEAEFERWEHELKK